MNTNQTNQTNQDSNNVVVNQFKSTVQSSVVDESNGVDYTTDVENLSIADKLFVIAVLLMVWTVITIVYNIVVS